MRLRRRNAEIRRRNELELEEQRREERRHRGFFRTPSPSHRDSRPKNRLFLPPSLPNPVAGTSGIRQLPNPVAGPSGIRQLPKPKAPVRPPAPHVQQRPPVLQVQQPGLPQQQTQNQDAPARLQAPPRQDPLQRANEAWKEAGTLQNIC